MKYSILLVGTVVCVFSTSLDQIQRRQSNWTVGQTVETSSGPVTGHPASNDSQVSEYLGIPFAEAPTGELRFAPPVKYTGNSPLNGSVFGFSCPSEPSALSQPLPANSSFGLELMQAILGNMGASYSEDCLFVNVWTKPQVGEAKKAVLMWVYGGGFVSGSSTIGVYNGANIAEQEDVIVVSFNYRLSILGFPGNPAGSNNLALLDQRLAVEWVRENIENFGGDPTRITIFGQSAGGASVDLYSYAWTTDPIVAGVIAESGTAISWEIPKSKANSEAAWFNVTATLGCGNASTNATTVLSCMRGKTYEEIINAIPPNPNFPMQLGNFIPTVDDTIVFSDTSARTPAAVPLLVGNNDHEAGAFQFVLADSNKYNDSFWSSYDLISFTCPSGLRANDSVKAGNPTWRYRYFGIFPNMAISPTAGAYHTAELPILFDTTPLVPPATEAEVEIGKYLRGAWAAFAKDPREGLKSYGDGWPEYEEGGESLVRLAWENETGTNAVSPVLYDAGCAVGSGSGGNVSASSSLPPLPTATVIQASGSRKIRISVWGLETAGLLVWFFLGL